MSAAQASRGRTGARGQAVIIEDVAADRALLEGILLSHGYTPRIHEKPDLDPAQMAASQPRLILLSADVKNGFNLCLHFKKDAVLRRVPLVLVTAKASPEVIRRHRLLPTRADAYLTKPLTEAAVLETLAQLLPEDFGPNAREVEVQVAEAPDRTLVSNGTLESAVVNYVEEEVRGLKDVVERLMTEKAHLGGKVVDLESQVKSQRVLLDSGLEKIGRTDSTTGPIPVVTLPEAPTPPAVPEVDTEEFEERLESARREGYASGLEAGRTERRAKGLEQGRREGRAEAMAEFAIEREELEATVATLTLKLKETEARAAETAGREAGYRAELSQMTELFERLEGGYKDALAKTEADKASAETALASVEAERDALAARIEAAETGGKGHAAALAERDERVTALEQALAERDGEIGTLRGEVAALTRRVEAMVASGTRIAELERELADAMRDLEAARESLADLEPLRQAEAAARADAERLRARVERALEALEAVEEPS